MAKNKAHTFTLDQLLAAKELLDHGDDFDHANSALNVLRVLDAGFDPPPPPPDGGERPGFDNPRNLPEETANLGADQPPAPSSYTMKQLLAAKKLVDRGGSIDHARSLLDALDKLGS